MLYKLLSGTVVGSLIFFVYLSTSPKTRGITFRPDDEGNIRFTPANYFHLAIYPLQSLRIWHPKLWDINWFMYVILSTGSIMSLPYIEKILSYRL